MLRPSIITLLLCLVSLVLTAGCISTATQRFADNLSQAIVNQDDPATVRAGAPAYLLLVDGLIEGEPENMALLMAGSKLYGSYATVFVKDPERARRLAGKAWTYARRALCLRHPTVCTQETAPYNEFVPVLAEMTAADVPLLYTYGVAWAGWIQTNSSDWDALAELPKLEAVMERVIALDEGFEQGQAHLYLAVIRTQLPPSMGGRPEEGRIHFERAIELSGGRNLIAKVEFARRYGRLTFDQSLHDRLLHQVLEADPVKPGLTLSNVIAQQQARELLDESEAYFQE